MTTLYPPILVNNSSKYKYGIGTDSDLYCCGNRFQFLWFAIIMLPVAQVFDWNQQTQI